MIFNEGSEKFLTALSLQNDCNPSLMKILLIKNISHKTKEFHKVVCDI